MSILIIGFGSIAKKHVTAIGKILPGTEIIALRSVKGAESYPGVRNVYEWDQLTELPDFVIISNPTQLHEETIRRAILLGCPLFIEKPVLADLIHAADLLAEVKKKKIITYIACNMRFHAALSFLKKYLVETTPVINEVNIYCGSYLPDWRPGRDFRTIYSANRAMGGGVHLDLMHELDYCHWLFGKPLEVSSLKRNVSSLGIDAVDFANYQLIYDSFTVGIGLNYYRRDSKRTLEIVTAEDTLLADLNTGSITGLHSGRVLLDGSFQMADTYRDQMAYFTESIKRGEQPMNGLEEGIEVLKNVLT